MRPLKLLPLLPIFTCLAFQASQPAFARDYATIDVPGSNSTEAFAINSNGDIVGMYIDSTFHQHGFLLRGDTFTTLDFPGAEETEPHGINLNGDIVGNYFTASGSVHGFLLHDGTFTSIDVPGATGTFANGLNDQGDIVGAYFSSPRSHGFLRHAGVFTDIDAPFPGFPTFSVTIPWAIDSQGDIVGYYLPFQVSSGFLFHAGEWSSISIPGADQTVVLGRNSKGDIAGSIFDGIGFHGRGFVISGGVVTLIDVPGAVFDGSHRGTKINGINDRGDFVGRYTDDTRTHGFVSLNSTTVAISIKPGESLAPINMQSRGTLPVAILSNTNFDATTAVDRSSLTFGRSGSEPSLSFCNAGGGDVDGDGFPDLVCHFTTQLTGFQSGDVVGVLKGTSINGTPIQGQGPVRVTAGSTSPSGPRAR